MRSPKRSPLLRKGTIQPNVKLALDEGSNKQVGFANLIQLEKCDEPQRISHVKWLYDLISCIELTIKETNVKDIIQKYCSIFKELIGVERIHILKLNKLSTKFETYVKGEKREVLVTERLLFKIFKETKMLVIHDTSDHRMFDPRFNKFFEMKIKNMLAIPIIQKNGSLSGIAMVLNRKKPYRSAENSVKWFSKTHELLAHLLSYLVSNLYMVNNLRKEKEKETERVESLINATEDILSKPSSLELIRKVESFVMDFMDCHRVTFYMYQSVRNELYKVYKDTSGQQRILAFSSQKGICGFVASTCTTVVLHEVYDDNRYNPEIGTCYVENASMSIV